VLSEIAPKRREFMEPALSYNSKMTMKNIILGLTFGTSISVVSWMIGIIFNGIFGKKR
jgi:hypothetical protein